MQAVAPAHFLTSEPVCKGHIGGCHHPDLANNNHTLASCPDGCQRSQPRRLGRAGKDHNRQACSCPVLRGEKANIPAHRSEHVRLGTPKRNSAVPCRRTGGHAALGVGRVLKLPSQPRAGPAAPGRRSEARFGDLLPRLRCSSCGARPSRIVGLDTRGRQIGLLGAADGGGSDRGGRLPDVAAQWGLGHPREKTDVR